MSDVFEIRRENLLSLIKDTYQGNRAEFCRATGKNPNLINLVLTSNAEYRRNIGEKLARDIEQRANIAAGWMDAPRGIGIRKVTKVPILTNTRDIPESPPMQSDYHVTLPVDDPILSLRLTGTANLLIVAVQDSNMNPTFRVGDHVWVDLGIKKIQGDGIYAIKTKDGTMFRRIQQLATGEFRVSTDDPAYAPQIIKGKPSSALRVVGKAIACNHRRAL